MSYDASVRVKTDVDNSDLAKLQKEFDDISIKLDKLYKKSLKLEELGVDKQSRQWKSLQYDTAEYEGALYEVEEKIKDLKTVQDSQSGGWLDNLKKKAKQFFDTMHSGTKKQNGLLKTMSSRFKGIALSLLVFNWITKAFNAMVSAMREGFKNLAKYSSDYNSSMSALKSETERLKNTLAVAFEPIANAIIPKIAQFISWINSAIESMSKFLAIIQGKNSYTRAKKQVIDYAKSLDGATKSAKGALAAFDNLNVLNNNQSAGASGGALTGEDAFEEVEISQIDLDQFDSLIEKLKMILGLLTTIGITLAAIGASGALVTFIGYLLFIGGLLATIVGYMDAWANGIDFSNLTTMLLGLTATITGIYLLFGPMAAGLTAIVGGVALVVLAIKDMFENGLNLKNVLTLIIGLVVTIVAVFLTFGSTAGIVVAAIAAVVSVFALMITIAGNGEEAIARLKLIFKNFGDFIKKLFQGDIKGALNSLKECFKEVLNFGMIVAESFTNCLIKALNWLVEMINKISFEVPDWVPLIGGKQVGFSLPSFNEVRLPRLAEGAVIQGGRPFAAILGDQRVGQTNIETPLSTMVQAFKQAMAETGGMVGDITLIATLDGEVVYRDIVRRDALYRMSHGGESAFA